MTAIYENGRIKRVEGKINEDFKYSLVATSIPSLRQATCPVRVGLNQKVKQERRAAKRMIVECPECDADVSVPGDSDMADVLECDECGAKLEIVGLDPIEVELVDDSEDFDEEYD